MIIEKNKIKSSVRITENAYSAIYNLFGQGRREDLEEEIKRQIVGLRFFAKPFTIVGFLHRRGQTK